MFQAKYGVIKFSYTGNKARTPFIIVDFLPILAYGLVYMRQVKTITYSQFHIGISGRKDQEEFDEAINTTIRELPGTIIDVKLHVEGSLLTAMIIYETGEEK